MGRRADILVEPVLAGVLAFGLTLVVGTSARRDALPSAAPSPHVVEDPRPDPTTATPSAESRAWTPSPPVRYARGVEAARLRSRLQWLEAERTKRILRELEDARFDNPLDAIPSFADERISDRHRPAAFEAAAERVRDALRAVGETGDVAVDCSAVPCILSLDLEVGDDYDPRKPDLPQLEPVGSAMGLAAGSTSAISWGAVHEGRTTVRLWWGPVDAGEHPTFHERISDSAWGRIDDFRREERVLRSMAAGLSREEAERRHPANPHVPGTGP